MSDAERILWQDRLALVGPTGCGKSTVARGLCESLAGGTRLIIDPADSDGTLVPGHVTVRGDTPDTAKDAEVIQRTTRALEAAYQQGARTIRFVPANPARWSDYEAAYAWALRRAPAHVWCDEGRFAFPSIGKVPPSAERYQAWGRKFQAGHMLCHIRPVEINRNAIAQAEHVLTWRQALPSDRQVLAEVIGLELRELERLMMELQPARTPDGSPHPTATGFLWFDRRRGELIVCPPLETARA